MKVKALILGLVIAAATALSYTAISDYNADQAIDKSKFKIPGQSQNN
jgi:uncharacterized protein (UPF0333 family)